MTMLETTSIERDPSIRFHEEGTLDAVTRWIASHDEGLAEWFKNARRAYQPDRADVAEKDRAALLLLKDADGDQDARIGLLDVGGATLEDVTAWSTWQDPRASSRSSDVEEEETQGNGGKAYMYRLFTGPARILGVRDDMRNCKGFEGPSRSVERGTPGFIPSAAAGREVPIVSFEAELEAALEPYGLTVTDLPEEVRVAVLRRQGFTLVEGVAPTGYHKGRIEADELLRKAIRHEQSTIALQRVRSTPCMTVSRSREGGRSSCPRSCRIRASRHLWCTRSRTNFPLRTTHSFRLPTEARSRRVA
jgi:hypothetical protein